MLGRGEHIRRTGKGIKGVRLLVVEDNAVNLGVAVEMLSRTRWERWILPGTERGCRFLDAPEDTYDA